MPRKWTAEEKAAQSVRLKAAWARRKAAQQRPKPAKWVGINTAVDARAVEDMERAKALKAKVTWWQRIKLWLGFRQGA